MEQLNENRLYERLEHTQGGQVWPKNTSYNYYNKNNNNNSEKKTGSKNSYKVYALLARNSN